MRNWWWLLSSPGKPQRWTDRRDITENMMKYADTQSIHSVEVNITIINTCVNISPLLSYQLKTFNSYILQTALGAIFCAKSAKSDKAIQSKLYWFIFSLLAWYMNQLFRDTVLLNFYFYEWEWKNLHVILHSMFI